MTELLRSPDITISNETMAVLERLAEGLEHRNPELAAQFFEELARAKTVPALDLPGNVITVGSHVRFRDDTTGIEQSITLDLPEQADISQGRVSVATPVGIALIGLRCGAKFSWVGNDGERHRLMVLEVSAPS